MDLKRDARSAPTRPLEGTTEEEKRENWLRRPPILKIICVWLALNSALAPIKYSSSWWLLKLACCLLAVSHIEFSAAGSCASLGVILVNHRVVCCAND